LRLCASQPGETLERRMPRERPLTQSAQNAIMGSKGYATSGATCSCAFGEDDKNAAQQTEARRNKLTKR
jgi:hypothetical protein